MNTVFRSLKRNTLKNLLIILLGLSCSLKAQAVLLGLYVNANLFYADSSLKDNETSRDKRLTGGGFSLSYQGSPSWRLEGGRLLSMHHETHYVTEGTYKKMLPLSTHFNVYGKLSLGKTSTSWVPGFGGGITYNLIPELLVDISWTRNYLMFATGIKLDESLERVMIGFSYYLG